MAASGFPDFVSLTSALSDKPLTAEMAAAGAVVVLFSDEPLGDERALAETGLAVSLGKPVIAVVPGERRPSALDIIEARTWIVGAGSRDTDHVTREIYRAVVEAMRETDEP
jgi:hypothetical protein